MGQGGGCEREGESPVLVITEQGTGMVFAHVVPRKGPGVAIDGLC